MEATLRNTPALLNHIDNLTGLLVRRFLNIIDLARIPKIKSAPSDEDDASDAKPDDPPIPRVDRNQAAVNKLRMEVETAALVRFTFYRVASRRDCSRYQTDGCEQIRAAENIVTLTRQMKEMWLFGQLDTLRRSEVEKRTEEDALVVAEILGRFRERGVL